MAHAATDERHHADDAPEVVEARVHDGPDPDAAPMHHDIRWDFSGAQVFIAGLLGTVALAAGVILGIVLAND